MIDKRGASQSGLEDERGFESSLLDDPTSETGTHVAAPLTPEESEPWTGKRLGHFRLLRSLGTGSMGRVIQAIDVNLQRIVALKILRKRIRGMDDSRRVHQFLREARAAAQIEHPNIVRIFEINEFEGWWYIAMEMVEGDTMESVVKAAGPLPPHRACPLIADAATALAVAHEAGIVHRDVKPSNLMVTRTGRGKLADFGLARVNDPNDPFDLTGKSVGTPKYMAPEVIEQKHPDTAVDVYALGGTLWYALTGQPPYGGKTVTEILYKHMHNPLPEPTQIIAGCSESLSELLKRMLAKDPALRPSAAEVAAALRVETIGSHADESGSHGSGIWSGVLGSSHAKPTKKQLSRRVTFVAIPATILILVIAAALIAINRSDGPKKPATTLEKEFANTPAGYGLREPDSPPVASDATVAIPAHSWSGKIERGEFKFVASRRGRHFWPIDHPMAVLITAEDFVGYKSEDQAAADAKIPAK